MNVIKDPLDELLKADAARHRDSYINDDGFTLRVVDALPARTRLTAPMRSAILGGITLFAALFVALFAGGGNFLVDAAMDIATRSLTQSAIAFIALVAILIGISIVATSDH